MKVRGHDKMSVKHSLFCLCILITSAASIDAQSQVRRARSSCRPLEEQIRPQERVLILESQASPPLLVQTPEGMSTTEAMTDYTDVAIVVVIVDKQSRVTPRGNWITSTVMARVERILKSHRLLSAA
jgi:hypothetical protein